MWALGDRKVRADNFSVQFHSVGSFPGFDGIFQVLIIHERKASALSSSLVNDEIAFFQISPSLKLGFQITFPCVIR